MVSAPKLGRLRVHSVLYGNESARIAQAIAHLDRAAEIAKRAGIFEQINLIYGDCSPRDDLRDTVLAANEGSSGLDRTEYVFFDANLGSAQGHNRLLEVGDSEFVLIMNPDIMLAPNAIVELARAFDDAKVGVAEAKQLPVEHPKVYDPVSGETPWAATACTLISRKVIQVLDGFDFRTFFLYCDDVDFSWRAKLAGYKVVYRPSAAAFHDKRLGAGGSWVVGGAEKYYSAEAALLIAYKYSRNDLVTQISAHFRESGDEVWLKALTEFERRREAGVLPEQLDCDHKVATFINGAYATHRFAM